MTENLLQFIWQFQYFNKQHLCSFDGEQIEIMYAGTHNTNQGPDFLNAKIKIGATIFAGSVEIHIKASEWKDHNHSADKNYNNVILHVVWENNTNLNLNFPAIELNNRVSNIMLEKYESMMQMQQFIPCQEHITTVKEITLNNWKERLIIERLQHKATITEQKLQLNKHHWEETFWQLLAKNFGIKINAEAFEKIAETIPLNIIAKHKNQLHQIEALLLGQANLLEDDFEDAYAIMLQKEFHFLQKKYQLTKVHNQVYFLRMRPANFPTIRLSQLAALIHKSTHLFSTIKTTETLAEVIKLFEVTANDYWHYHYTFAEKTNFKEKVLGKQMAHNIIINTIIPLLYAYGWYNNEERYKDKALRWGAQLPAEKNNITNGFNLLGIINKSAYDSQALIQLKNIYCNHKKCLQCAIGNSILKQ